MRLYEIEDQIANIFDNPEINEETGEVIIDFEALENLEMLKEKKIENIIKYYLDLEGEITKFADEAKKIAAKKKSLENKKESLKKYLHLIHQGSVANYGIHTIKYRKSQNVIPTEKNILQAIPKMYRVVKTTADLGLMKCQLKIGIKVKGWELKENLNIQIK